MGPPPTRPFHSDGKSKLFRVGHFDSDVRKSKPLRGDHNKMGLTSYSAFPLQWEIQSIQSRKPLLRCREIQTTRRIATRWVSTPTRPFLSTLRSDWSLRSLIAPLRDSTGQLQCLIDCSEIWLLLSSPFQL